MFSTTGPSPPLIVSEYPCSLVPRFKRNCQVLTRSCGQVSDSRDKPIELPDDISIFVAPQLPKVATPPPMTEYVICHSPARRLKGPLVSRLAGDCFSCWAAVQTNVTSNQTIRLRMYRFFIGFYLDSQLIRLRSCPSHFLCSARAS